MIKRNWHFFNAEDEILGRLATRIAHILMGKNKPSYVPWQDRGDSAVVTNAGKIKVTGQKEKQKVYFRHSGFPGGFREKTLEKLRQRRPKEIIRKAVFNMLPKNKLRKGRMNRLKLFLGEKHPYTNLISKSQIPDSKSISKSPAKRDPALRDKFQILIPKFKTV